MEIQQLENIPASVQGIVNRMQDHTEQICKEKCWENQTEDNNFMQLRYRWTDQPRWNKHNMARAQQLNYSTKTFKQIWQQIITQAKQYFTEAGKKDTVSVSGSRFLLKNTEHTKLIQKHVQYDTNKH